MAPQQKPDAQPAATMTASVNSTNPPTKVERPTTQVSVSEQEATKNFLTIMIAVTVIVLLAGGYFIYTLTGKYVRQSNEIKAQDQLITSLKKKKVDLEALKPNYSAITAKGSNGVSDADLILRALPVSEDYKSLIASLELIGQESGVKVTSVTQSSSGESSATAVQTTTAASKAKSFGFSVNIEGPYEKIFTFLQNTERSARVMNFTSMTLSGNSGVVSANLTMKTYWQPPANIKSTMRPLR